MPFELTQCTPATLSSVTPRIEKHGDADVPAVTLGLRITAANTLLDLLEPGLLAMLYKPVEVEPAQGELPEVEQATSMPLLRVRIIEELRLRGELSGWALAIEYGIDESSAIHLGQCKVDKFRVTPAEGGSIELALRIGTRDVDEESMGRLTMLLGHEINITLIAPVRDSAPVIDGSVDAFAKDHPEFAGGADAGDLFAEQHGGEGGAGDGAASDQHAGDFGQADDDSAGPGAGSSDDAPFGEPQRGEAWPFPQDDGAADSEGGETDQAGDAAEFEAGAKAALEKAGVAPRGRRGRKVAGVVE
jgi:hypothetical protein